MSFLSTHIHVSIDRSLILLYLAFYSSFSSGKEIAEAISYGGSLSGKYELVEGGVSVDRGVAKTFQDSFQYALFTYNEQLLQVGYSNYHDKIDEEFLKQTAERAGRFDSTNTASIFQYRNLFSAIGTHVITEANYGSRLSLVSQIEYFGSIYLITGGPI